MKYLIMIAGALALAACSQSAKWSLIYQPDVEPGEQFLQISNLKMDAINGYYDTLEQCRLKGQGLRRLAGDKGDYVCGFNCSTNEQGLLACDDLSR